MGQTESNSCHAGIPEKNWHKCDLANIIMSLRWGMAVNFGVAQGRKAWGDLRCRVPSRWLWRQELLPSSFSPCPFSSPLRIRALGFTGLHFTNKRGFFPLKISLKASYILSLSISELSCRGLTFAFVFQKCRRAPAFVPVWGEAQLSPQFHCPFLHSLE